MQVRGSSCEPFDQMNGGTEPRRACEIIVPLDPTAQSRVMDAGYNVAEGSLAVFADPTSSHAPQNIPLNLVSESRVNRSPIFTDSDDALHHRARHKVPTICLHSTIYTTPALLTCHIRPFLPGESELQANLVCVFPVPVPLPLHVKEDLAERGLQERSLCHQQTYLKCPRNRNVLTVSMGEEEGMILAFESIPLV